MKPVIIGIPGYNSNGKYIRKLWPYFKNAGYGYCPFIYGKVFICAILNLIANRYRTDDIASRLIAMVSVLNQDVILVGHSNGGMLAWMVSNACENVIGVVLLNAALDEDTEFKCWVINCYHPDDWTLKVFAYRRINSKWGRAGAVEMESADINLNLKDSFRSWNPHSKIFVKENSNLAMPRIIKAMESLL